MADPLSITASAIAVATVSFEVARGLYEVAEGIGSSGDQVRASASEISAFSRLLISIKTEVSRPTGISLQEQNLVHDVVEVCENIMQPLQRLQGTLKPLLERFRDCPAKLRQFGLRVQFVFSCKNKLWYYLELLRNQSTILTAVLSVMNLQANRDKSPLNVYLLQHSLELSIQTASHSIRGSQSVGRNRPLLIQQFTSDVPTSAGTSNSGTIPAELEEPQNEDGPQSESKSEVLDAVPSSNTALVVSRPTGEDSEDGLTTVEVQQFDEQIANDLDRDDGTFTMEVWQDMHSVARKVLRHAEQVLRSSRDDTTIAEAAPAAVDLISPPQAEAQLESIRASQPTSQLESHPLSVDQKESSIIFESSERDLYQLPYESVRTWEGMYKLIKSIEPNIKRTPETSSRPNNEKVWCTEEKRYLSPYILTQKDGKLFLSHTWSHFIRPNDYVKLRFIGQISNKSRDLKMQKAQLEEEKEHLEMQKVMTELDERVHQMSQTTTKGKRGFRERLKRR